MSGIRVAVLGDGGWGTALALVNFRRGNEVMMWSAFVDYVKVLHEERENVKFLPGVKLPKGLKITADLKEAVDFGDVLVLAIPSQYLRNILSFRFIEEAVFKRHGFFKVLKCITVVPEPPVRKVSELFNTLAYTNPGCITYHCG